VGLGKIKRETACHHLLSQPECKIFFIYTKVSLSVKFYYLVHGLVVHVKRALVSRKKGKEYFLEKLILRFDRYSFLSFSDFSFFFL
jgi:hypothetical protein